VTSQLVVANYDGGTISIIDVALDKYGNDSAAFGTTYTVKVGNNPASVTALFYNGSYAYVANQADGTVSVVNLTSHTVEATLPVTGHPRTIVSTQSSEEYGKVYVASPDSNELTIINAGGTNMNTVEATLLLDGNLVDVRVSAQNGVSGNSNNVSRLAGYGQPCNLPGTAPTASITACRARQ
jgi:YVTN family beta-propeller protein